MFRRFLLIAPAVALAACTPVAEEPVVEAEPVVAPVAAVTETDIVSTARAADNLTTLVTAIEAAGLADTLSGPGPFTVLAPTDAAFAALPPNSLQQLLLPENQERLRALLAYHVLPGEMMSANVAGQQGAVPTVLGPPLQIDATTAGIRIDGANVIAADIDATNGVIHIIDRVLVPEAPPAS